MLVIRLLRRGKKHQPTYKIVVTDRNNSPIGGRFVEEVGFYNPKSKERILKKERIQYWLSQGVKPSNTVHNMLVSEKIIEGAKIDVHKKSKKEAPVEEKKEEGKTPVVLPTAEKKEVSPVAESPVEEKKEEAPVEEKTASESVEEEKKEEVSQEAQPSEKEEESAVEENKTE